MWCVLLSVTHCSLCFRWCCCWLPYCHSPEEHIKMDDETLLNDSGILYNFPITIFHRDKFNRRHQTLFYTTSHQHNHLNDFFKKHTHYRGIMYRVVLKRFIYSFGLQVWMQLLILHNNYSDPLFQPLQLFLKSSADKWKISDFQRKVTQKLIHKYSSVTIPCRIWPQLPSVGCTRTGCESLGPNPEKRVNRTYPPAVQRKDVWQNILLLWLILIIL